jgi:hypothetical protein
VSRFCPLTLLVALVACGTPADPPADPEPRGEAPATAPPPATLHRLTATQYRHAIRDLFGPGLVLPARLEPDERIDGLFAVGAANTTISSYGAERYAEAAYDVAEQVLADPARRERWVDCDVASDSCRAGVLDALGHRAWRRPLSDDERTGLVAIVDGAAEALGDADEALSFGMAAILMSPNFLYRPELGTTGGALDAHELASRLSFFLWETLPDEALLAAAEDGTLLTDDALAAQVDRMLADDRARDGVRALFTQLFELDELDHLVKDPTVFTYLRDSLGDSAREETLLGLEALIFEDDGSYLDLFTTRRTFLDRDLAALYGVVAPTREGFGETWLPDDGGRAGLFGQASFLAVHSHPTGTSPTLRGMFIREVILCHKVPEPPAMENTAIPEPSPDAPTMRDRLAVHLEAPVCSACHELTDPLGLAFENLDGLGGWREMENGTVIDPSGHLDDVTFTDGIGAGRAIAQHPDTPLCFAQHVLQVATGATVEELDDTWVGWHSKGFVDAGHRVQWLLRDVALSPAFRSVGGAP